ncbi:MAG: hypothetical protein KME37_09615 [Candidatus Thiodiazotropha sp. (ex Codakia orbicularis)]|nr:hypothetical protein [Candidatus Thiodiazotropha sp. (ex Codakia orbicularis)]
MYELIRYLAMLIWAFVGLLLWIPFLVRTIISFNWFTIYSAVTKDQEPLRRSRATIEFAQGFYISGFKTIEAYTEDKLPQGYETNQTMDVHGFGRFVLEVIWAALWWVVTLYPATIINMIMEYGGWFIDRGWITFLLGAGTIIAFGIFAQRFEDKNED